MGHKSRLNVNRGLYWTERRTRISPKPISLRGVKLCELVDGLPRIFENKKGEEEVVPFAFLWQQEMGRIAGYPFPCG